MTPGLKLDTLGSSHPHSLPIKHREADDTGPSFAPADRCAAPSGDGVDVDKRMLDGRKAGSVRAMKGHGP